MSDLNTKIQEYNELVGEWNKQYGHLTEGMTVDVDEFQSSYIKRVKSLTSKRMSGRKKVSVTVTTIGDFENLDSTPNKDSISRGELASLIVNSGNSILESV